MEPITRAPPEWAAVGVGPVALDAVFAAVTPVPFPVVVAAVAVVVGPVVTVAPPLKVAQ